MNQQQREELAQVIIKLEDIDLGQHANFDFNIVETEGELNYVGNREGLARIAADILKMTLGSGDDSSTSGPVEIGSKQGDGFFYMWVKVDDDWQPGKVYVGDQEETTMDKLLPYGCFIVVAFLAITFIAGLIKLSELIF